MRAKNVGPAVSLATLSGAVIFLVACSTTVEGTAVENATDVAAVVTSVRMAAADAVCDAVETGNKNFSDVVAKKDSTGTEGLQVLDAMVRDVQASLTKDVPLSVKTPANDFIDATEKMATYIRTGNGDSKALVDDYFAALRQVRTACSTHGV